MPELDFQVADAQAAVNGIAPLVEFPVRVKSSTHELIHSVLLHAQIQIQPPQRSYSAREKKNLVELFGAPERWGQTLRNWLWTAADTTIGSFTDEARAVLRVPCTYDLSLAATKYFNGLEDGEVPLLFLFSGTIFYASADGQWRVQPISWNKESAYRMPVACWKGIMEKHFSNSAWLYLRRDVFDRLYAFKRAHGDATWEQTLDRLLPEPAPAMSEAAP